MFYDRRCPPIAGLHCRSGSAQAEYPTPAAKWAKATVPELAGILRDSLYRSPEGNLYMVVGVGRTYVTLVCVEYEGRVLTVRDEQMCTLEIDGQEFLTEWLEG
jgi:hypothetical protein